MRILLVEDTEDVAEPIVATFSRHGHAVDHMATRQAAEDALAVQEYDLVILDLMLPDGSGLDILRGLRAAQCPTPVLILTARLDVDDRVDGLDTGADDYLTKPFDLRELEARARALIRRQSEVRSGVVVYGDLRLDAAAQRASVKGTPLSLARREFRLLEILLAAQGRVIPKDRLFDKLFSFEETEVGVNALELYIARLRRKLAASNVSIRTLRGLGYQLERHE
jgi:two-component system response regulator TctD